MNNLFDLINVSSCESLAVGSYASISYDDWINQSSCDEIHSALESLGVNSDWQCYFEGVDVIENYLNSLHPGESVYFWIN